MLVNSPNYSRTININLIVGILLTGLILPALSFSLDWDIRTAVYFSLIQTVVTWIYLETLFVIHSYNHSDVTKKSFFESAFGWVFAIMALLSLVSGISPVFNQIDSKLTATLSAIILSIIVVSIETYRHANFDLFLKNKRDALLRLSFIIFFAALSIDITTTAGNMSLDDATLLVVFLVCRFVIELVTLLPMGMLSK